MKYKIYSMVALIIIVVGVFIYTSPDNISIDRPISIGVISSETGDFGTIGGSFSEGVRFAFEQYIVKNPNSKITLYTEDDGTDSKKALSAYNKLVSLNKIDGLINFSSPSINIIYDSVTKSGLPVLQLGEQDIDPAADSVYQIYPTQDVPEIATGEYVKKLSNGSDTVLFYTNDSTVMKFVGNIKKGYGQNFVEEFKLDQNQKEYRTIVTKAMAHNPKYVVISAFTQNGARVVQELLKYKNRPTIIFDLTYDATEYSAIFPDLKVLDGVYAMSLVQNLDTDFVNLFKAKYGREPNAFTGYGYDAFNTLMSGYDENKNTWIKNIGATNTHGVTGKISFNGLGLRAPDFEMKVVKGGVLSKVQ